MRDRFFSVGLLGLGALMTQALPCAYAATPISGVAGEITISPTCPGPVRPERTCIGPFAGAKVELLNAAGQPVGSAISSAEGRFKIKAVAGNYDLKVQVEGMYPRCATMPVRIRTRHLEQAAIECDSGMR